MTVKPFNPRASFKVREKLPSGVVSTVISLSKVVKITVELGVVFPWIRISGSKINWLSLGLDKFKVRLTGSEVTGLIPTSCFFSVPWFKNKYNPPKRRRPVIKIPSMEIIKNPVPMAFFGAVLLWFPVGSSVSMSFDPFYILKVSC